METSTNQNGDKQKKWLQAVRFMRWQAGLLVFCVIAYSLLHFLKPAAGTFPTPDKLIHIDPFGRATVISAEDLDWYVGSDKSVPLLTQMNERNKNIEARLGNLHQQLQDFASQFSEEVAGPVRNAAEQGLFSNAVHEVTLRYATLAPDSLANGSDLIVNQTEQTLRELAELQRAQQETLTLFCEPEKFKLFWVDPWGVLFEVAAWSLFGLFSSLLYHSARYARKGKFKVTETAVGWTKIFYTPVVAIVLSLAIADGLLHVSPTGTRIWMIPLLGFLAGFSARKAAKVVDGLAEWALGRMARSLQGNDDNSTSPGVAAIVQALPPPKDYNDLEIQAKAMLVPLIKEKLNQQPKTS